MSVIAAAGVRSGGGQRFLTPPDQDVVYALVCETLSFSKKLANHVDAFKLFICPDNLTRAAA